jgi:HEAT repeat protein
MRPIVAWLIVAAVSLLSPVAFADEPAEPRARPAADPSVVETLESDDPLVLRGALTELSSSDPATIPADVSARLTNIALEGTDTKARELALQVLGQMGTRVIGRPRLWPKLARQLDVRRKAPPGRVRGWSAWTLGKTGAPVDDYGIVMLGAMSPYDDFSRAAALEAFLSLGGDVPGFLRKALVASQPGGIRANIIGLLGQVPVAEGGMTADEARQMLETAHRTEQSALVFIAITRMKGTPEELAWLNDQLAQTTDYFALRQILVKLTERGPLAAYAAPAVCDLLDAERAPTFQIYDYFAAVGAAPEAMCAIPKLTAPEYGSAAATALLSMGGAGLAVLVKWLRGGDPTLRHDALSALAKSENAPWPAFDAVLTATADEEAHIRSAAASVLPVFGAVGQVHLRRMLADDEPWVREAVVRRIEGPDVQEILIEQLDSDTERVATIAVARLGEVEGELGPTEVLERVEASRVPLGAKLELAEALGLSVLDMFEERASSDDPKVRADATKVALRLTGSAVAVVPTLALLVDDPDQDVREGSIRTLEHFGPAAAPAVDSLRSALLDPDWSVRFGAVRALGAIGPAASAALPELREMLRSGSRANSTIVEAVVAIGGMDKEFVDDFVATLGSGSGSRDRTNAARMLAHAKGSAKARAALRAVLSDADEHVRWAAAKSLEQIGNTEDRQRAKAVLDEMGPFAPMRPLRGL